MTWTALRELDRTGRWDLARRLVREVGDDDCVTYAAGCAFKVFVSFFPGAIAVLAVTRLVGGDSAFVGATRRLGELGLPDEGVSVVETVLGTARAASPDSVGLALASAVVVALVSASGASATLVRALNSAYDVTDRRPFLRQRLVGLAVVGLLLATLVGVVATVVAGPQLADLLVGAAGSTATAVVRVVLQVLAGLLLVVTLVDVVYFLAPNRRAPWDWLSPGSVVAVVGWLVASLGFRLYVQGFSSYDAYGALAGVVVVLLWLQLSVLAILVGAEVDAELDRLAGTVPARPPAPEQAA